MLSLSRSCSKFISAGLLGLLTAGALPAIAEPADSLVAQAARQFLLDQAAHAGWQKPVVEVSVIGERKSLACPRPVNVEPLDTRYPGRMRFAAHCPGAEGGRLNFVVRGEISAEILVTTTALSAGRGIAGADLTLERRDITTIPDALSEPAAVVGQSSRRSLRSGQIVQRQMLVAPMLVRRGDAVHVVARSGPVEVTTSGEALDAGRSDDIIRVRNTATGKVIRTRVRASGTVEPVDLPMLIPPQSPD